MIHYLQHRAGFDEILLQDVVKARIQLFLDVFNQQWFTEHQAVFDVCAKVLVIQRRYLNHSRNG